MKKVNRSIFAMRAHNLISKTNLEYNMDRDLPMQTLHFRPDPCKICDDSWNFEPSYDFLMCEWFCPNCENRLEGEEQ